jgi:hypothetical protein
MNAENYENALGLKTTFSATDKIRMVIGGLSKNIYPQAFATVLESYLSSGVKSKKVRTVDATGAINATDNLVLTEGTITLTMPDPSLLYDASNTTSVEITVAQKTSGTVTISPFGSAQFRDGSGGSPYPSWSLTGGTSVSFGTDGTDYIVTSS